MTITARRWLEIRDRFNKAEKDALNDAIQAESLVPKGWMINEDELEPELRAKIERLRQPVRRPAAAAGRRRRAG